jgi:DNA-binding transcriptional MerR regulator
MDIGAVARASGLSIKMIRHYESIRLLSQVARTLANYRIYGANEVNTLRFIKRARSLGDDVRSRGRPTLQRSNAIALHTSLSVEF